MKNRVRWGMKCLWIIATLSTMCGCGGGGSDGGSNSGGVLSGASVKQSEVVAEQPQPVQVRAPERKVPACVATIFGDSIMYGGSLKGRLDEPPAATIKRLRPAYKIADLSVPGDTVDNRSFASSQSFEVDSIVVYEEGINDTSPPQSYELQLRELVERAKNQGAWVVLTGLSRQSLPSERRDRYNEIISKIAADTNSTFADWGSIELREGDLEDGIHPTKDYSDRLVERLIGALDGIAPHCSPQAAAN